MAKKKASAKRRAKTVAAKPKPKATVPVLPLGDRVLVRPLSEDELGMTTTSGIIIPETVDREKPEQGKVVAVGEGKPACACPHADRYDDGKLVKPPVKVGDRIVFSRYGYDEVKLNGEEYYIIKSENVLAIIK